MHRLLKLVTLAAVALLAACAQRGNTGVSPPPSPLIGTDWLLVAAEDTRVPEALPDPRPPYLRLEPGGRAIGYTAVNSFSGAYDIQGTHLSLGPLAMTRRAGPEPAMAIESALLHAFQGTGDYRIAGATLELLDTNGRVLARFVAKPAQ